MSELKKQFHTLLDLNPADLRWRWQVLRFRAHRLIQRLERLRGDTIILSPPTQSVGSTYMLADLRLSLLQQGVEVPMQIDSGVPARSKIHIAYVMSPYEVIDYTYTIAVHVPWEAITGAAATALIEGCRGWLSQRKANRGTLEDRGNDSTPTEYIVIVDPRGKELIRVAAD